MSGGKSKRWARGIGVNAIYAYVRHMSKRARSKLMIAVTTACAIAGVLVTVPAASQPILRSVSLPMASSASASLASVASLVPVTTTIATGLALPWGLAFLPDGTALFTLRDRAEVMRVAKGAAPVSLGRVPGVVPAGEGGLLGIAVSPTFASDQAVFVYFTSGVDNRVMRMTFNGTTLAPGPVIIQGIAKATFHNGGRLAFGPDGFLYVSTGDAGTGAASQSRGSLNGKILRVTTQGLPTPGNPFAGSRVWSLGHRNVQGLAWNKSGVMYASEFGQNTWDELNRILPGRNYGWPTVEGIAHRAGFVDPLRQWSTADASPSGIAVGSDGAIYMAALRGQSLWRIPLDAQGNAGTPQRLLQGTYGRLRTAHSAPDGRLWLMTSNGVGSTRPGDDRILSLRVPLPLPPAAVTRLSDFNRDGRTDLVARDSAGQLWLYPGDGAGGFLARRLMGAGWNTFNRFVTPGDVTGDGNGDVLARNAAGALRLYPGNGAGGLKPSRQIGAGWQNMNAITNAADMTGDGRTDILARDAAGGLWLYPMVGDGKFQPRRLVGTGWAGMTSILGVGDFSGDRRADILGRSATGTLLLYRGGGTGRVSSGVPAGSGWQGMTALVTPGNWDRASGNDVLARDAAGVMWLYPGSNTGRLGAREQIGAGWTGYTIA